jgi:hypothetical protein
VARAQDAAALGSDFDRAVRLAERGAELDRSSPALIMLAPVYGCAGEKDKVALPATL